MTWPSSLGLVEWVVDNGKEAQRGSSKKNGGFNVKAPLPHSYGRQGANDHGLEVPMRPPTRLLPQASWRMNQGAICSYDVFITIVKLL